MKICIPTQSNTGLEARVSGHFGKAPYFAIYDTEDKSINVIENISEPHGMGEGQHGKGTGRFLTNLGVDAVISFGMGQRLFDKMHQAGIEIYQVKASRVADVIENFESGDHIILAPDSPLIHKH